MCTILSLDQYCTAAQGGHLQQSTAMVGALKMSWDSSATFHTRHVLSMPVDTARSALPTSSARTSACRTRHKH